MNNIIQHCDQDQSASGQSSRDLRVNSDVMTPETQLDVNATEQRPDMESGEFPAPRSASFLVSSSFRRKTEWLWWTSALMSATPTRWELSMEACCATSLTQPWGFAYYTVLAADESFTTLELKINFLRPVWKATLRAKARVVRAGRFVGYVECDVVDEQERLVARASSSCLTLWGQLAEGRRGPALPTRGRFA